jgi:hypothetical protein
MKNKFTIQTTTKSHCGTCHGYLDLLCEASLTKKHLTMFFICWPCKRVLQVGIGDVPREESVPTERPTALDLELKALHNLQAVCQSALNAVPHQKDCARQAHDAAECTCIRAAIGSLEATLEELR